MNAPAWPPVCVQQREYWGCGLLASQEVLEKQKVGGGVSGDSRKKSGGISRLGEPGGAVSLTDTGIPAGRLAWEQNSLPYVVDKKQHEDTQFF